MRVTNTASGRSVVVRIHDRGPFIAGRSIDLARGAARVIGCGTCRVALQPH
ncbi:rare lipoprotein A [Methylorubrum extorquens]|nr:rare lipoprotein A [Methylorubrum extorquens]